MSNTPHSKIFHDTQQRPSQVRGDAGGSLPVSHFSHQSTSELQVHRPVEGKEVSHASQIEKTIVRMAHQIIEKTESKSPHKELVLLAIPHGGTVLVQRLADAIRRYSDLTIHTGVLDITMYRDDLHQGKHRAIGQSTLPSHTVDNALVILVDDVLFTGRSVRSALDALSDMGRPRIVQLAVLVDRGHRELPIRADYVGKNLPTSVQEKVKVVLTSSGKDDGIYLHRSEERKH